MIWNGPARLFRCWASLSVEGRGGNVTPRSREYVRRRTQPNIPDRLFGKPHALSFAEDSVMYIGVVGLIVLILLLLYFF
jgi:hypothetical protein